MKDPLLDHDIREFQPDANGSWLPLEALLARAFPSGDPTEFYDAIFNLFERFPEEDGAGVFWSALHGMEHVGAHEAKLAQYFRRQPSLMTKAMLLRLRNSGQTHAGAVPIGALLGPS